MKPDHRQTLAETISTIFGPVPMGVALGLAVGAHSGRGLLAGASWGLLSVACAAVLPALATRSLRKREARGLRLRLAYMTPAVVGAMVGLLLLWLLPAPRDVKVLAAGFAAGLVCSAAINTFYASSNHVAAVAGGAVLAGALLTPWALVAMAITGLQIWSRVATNAHTLPQATCGAVTGVLTASAVVLLT